MTLSTTSRSTPVGSRLDDGFSTKIAFAADADVSFWEKTVTPPGIDGGDPIDITNMFNSATRTKAARSLYEVTDASATVAYDPVVIDQILALVNVNGSITVHFPNGDTLDFFGYLRSFTPQENQEGEEPLADIVIVATNVDSSTGAETAPNYKTSVGTD